MNNMNEYQHLKREFEKVKSARDVWNPLYQILGEYIHMNKQNFETQPTQGEFLTRDIYDSDGPKAYQTCAASLLGMLWNGTARQSLELAPPDDVKPEEITTEVKEFYSMMTSKAVNAFDDPRANLMLSLDEYMQDQIVFGTSGVGVEKGFESKLLFRPYGVKELYLGEGKNGRVDRVYVFYEWTILRVVEEYGEDAVSEGVRKKYNDGNYHDCVKILHAIRPRRKKKAEKGKLAMPYESIHMEYDNCHLLKEDGFFDLPILAGRFKKLNYEVQGRSLAMNALPDIREANIMREAVIVATQKALDMPKGVYDGALGGGVLDTSPMAINVFDPTATLGGRDPVFDVGAVPNIAYAEARLEKLRESIAQHFYIDRLLDFNNTSQMTFGEAQIRSNIRASSLASLFNRQISEVFSPLIERGVAILWREGEFGVIKGSEEEAEMLAKGIQPTYVPDFIAQRLQEGKEVYKINYKTQAANASRNEEYLAIIDVLSFSMQSMQVDPSVAKRVNLHEGIKHISDIRGVPVGIIRQDDEFDELMAQEQQTMQAQQLLAGAEQVANIEEKASKVRKNDRE